MKANESLMQHVLDLLEGGSAHATFAHAVKGLSASQAGERPPGAPHSAWELVEHIRIAQHDILKFSQGPGWASPPWPEGYWPSSPQPPTAEAWEDALRAVPADLEEFENLLRGRAAEITEPFGWGDGQTLLREALLIADHNAYHIGQLVQVRQLLGIWPGA